MGIFSRQIKAIVYTFCLPKFGLDLVITCEQAHLWVAGASDKEQSDTVSLVKRHEESHSLISRSPLDFTRACASTLACASS